MLTMHSDAVMMVRALRAGADGYLVKDCSIEEIVHTIHRVASGQTDAASETFRKFGTEHSGNSERIVSRKEEGSSSSSPTVAPVPRSPSGSS